jgi:hypothetical protein
MGKPKRALVRVSKTQPPQNQQSIDSSRNERVPKALADIQMGFKPYSGDLFDTG